MIRPGIVAAPSRSRAPNGYALVGVIWICAAATALAFAASAASRHAVAASRNRVALARAEWTATGCLARARSVLLDAIAKGDESLRLSAWSRVDEILTEAPMMSSAGCDISARAVGSRLNVNEADETSLSRVFRDAGLESARADSLAAAIADWKDADEVRRPLGAEREWYEAVERPPPANRPFTHTAELMKVRGLEEVPSLGDLLDVEEGSISINHAPAPVLGRLPGFTPEAVSRVLKDRELGRPVTAFAELREGLSTTASEILAQTEPLLVAHASLVPQGWILTARSSSGAPAVTAVIEVRIERYGTTILIVRRRSWVN